MRLLAGMEAIWRSGDYTGPQRPMARVSVQRPKMALRSYGLMTTFTTIAATTSGVASVSSDATAGLVGNIDPSHGHKVTDIYADFLFTGQTPPLELPTVRSVSWTRDLSQDAASVTIECYNTMPADLPDSPTGVAPRQLDYPGAYTYNYGTAVYAGRWGHTKNPWSGMLMPDNLIRTYEGYGADWTTPPETDPNLAPTGVWLIDKVSMSALGIITITGRDLVRLLLDQQSTYPVVPNDWIPLAFQNWDQTVAVAAKVSTGLKVTGHHTSVEPWSPPIGDPEHYRGHRPADALDGDTSTYWLSVGNATPRARWAYEWFEIETDATTVSSIYLNMVKSGYTVYVSLKVGGDWKNVKGTINYHEDGIGRNGSNIPYVTSFTYTTAGTFTVPITANVTAVRVTFGNLAHFPEFGGYSYRAGVRTFHANGVASATSSREVKLTPGPAGANPWRYADYTDIVKLCCAWAGLYWPKGAYLRYSDASVHHVTFTRPDTACLGVTSGRVWGDFEQTGTTGPIPIDSTTVANKTLMDVVNYVREQVGFIFYADETGAIQWRLPNIYKVGSMIADGSSAAGYYPSVRTIDEKQILIQLDAAVDSTNLREIILIDNGLSGRNGYAAVYPGYNPNPVGLRRILIWADAKYLASQQEARRAAEMTAVRMLFTYRADNIVIPGFPGIQIDDQLRIFEQVTSEGNIHYVSAITSDNHLDTGEWTYSLTTNWLGEKPDTTWVLPADQLSDDLRAHLDNQDAYRQLRGHL